MSHARKRGASRQHKRHTSIVMLVVAGIAGVGILGIGGFTLWAKQIKPQVAHSAPASLESSQFSSSPPQWLEPELAPPQQQPTPVRDAKIPPIENGLAPVISKLSTKQPVVFLTIDDGAHKDPSDIELMKKYSLTASLFLTYNVIRNNPDFFKGFDMPIENHTISHRTLTNLSYADQKQEICDQADKMEELYGRRPVLFRPPGGSYNDDTRRAAADCGMKAVVMWSAKANGGSMQYQVGKSLRPGDIVLMHFRPEFKQDLQSFVDAMNTAGLHTELLEDWMAG